MLKLASTYLIVKDIKKSVEFYEALLQMKVSKQNDDRWAQFDFGGCIALYNPRYDEERIAQAKDLQGHYSKELIEYYRNREIRYGSHFVLNFYTEDLSTEYERVKGLNIGKISGIFFVNISSPYHFFLLEDPDGNTLEVTGPQGKVY